MTGLLQGSVFIRLLRAIGAWLGRVSSGSAIFSAIGRCWRASKTRAFLIRRLGAPDTGK